MIAIDGSAGEGGGQVLRSSLALSLVTGKPFRITGIRARRPRPGLMRQHLTAVLAAAEVGGAEVTGAEVGSRELEFSPGKVTAGDFHFSVGTAGSTTLVLQTVLPALALSCSQSTVVLEGGTHNPLAPTFDFLAKAFLPVLERLGPRCTAVLERPGFYPAGGGRIRVEIEPVASFHRLDLVERGAVLEKRALATVAQISRSIAEREVRVIQAKLGLPPEACHVESTRNSVGPGNEAHVEIVSEHITEVFTAFGERGVSAEKVGASAAAEAVEYLEADVPVGRHLADQLLVPMAVGSGGTFRTLSPSGHTETQISLVREFLGVDVVAAQLDGSRWTIKVGV